MQVEFAMNYPTICKFIEGIKKIQSGCDKVYKLYVCDKKLQQKYQKADKRIKKIVDDFQENVADSMLKKFFSS